MSNYAQHRGSRVGELERKDLADTAIAMVLLWLIPVAAFVVALFSL
jgi:hypothetical protein